MKKWILIFLLIPSVCLGSVEFDGSDDYLTCGNIFNFSGTASFSMSAWVDPDATAGTGTDMVIAKFQSGVAAQWHLGITEQSVGTWKARASREVSPWALLGATTVSDGLWHHIGMTYDGTNLRVYLDGVLDGGPTAFGSVATSSLDVRIGGEVAGVNDFNGKIDEVAVWNVALTAEEMAVLGGKRKRLPLEVRPSSLQSYWSLDDYSISLNTILYPEDTFLNNSATTTNYGSQTIHTMAAGDGDSYLQRYDFSSIPVGSTITSAIIWIYEGSRGCSEPLTAYLIDTDRDWVESEATYNIYKTANNWTTAGAGSSTEDYTTTGSKTWFNKNNAYGGLVVTDWVQDIVSGTRANAGWILKNGACSNPIYSSEHGSLPAYIDITYSDRGGTSYRDSNSTNNCTQTNGALQIPEEVLTYP